MRLRTTRAGGVLLTYLLLALVWWWPLVRHARTQTVQHATGDPTLLIWWIKWTPWAIEHGHDPLVSGYLQAPTGVSGIWNVSMASVGVVLWPFTAAFGPLFSYNLALVLACPLSAFTAFLWLRRHTLDATAALGGLVFGFNPAQSGQSQSHLHMSLLVLAPLLVMLVEDLCWRRPPITSWRPTLAWWRPLALAALCVVQFFTSSEVLVLTALGSALYVLLVALQHRSQVRARLVPVVRAAVVAVVPLAVVLAYPLHLLDDPRFKIGGPVQRLIYVGSPRLFVHPPPQVVAGGAPLPASLGLSQLEDGMYVGWALLVVLALAVALTWRRTGTRTAVVVAVVAAASQVHHLSPLLFLEKHVALLQNIVTARASVVMWAAFAYLLAVGAARAVEVVRGLPGTPRLVAGLALAVVLVGCLVPGAPRRLSDPVYHLGAPVATPAFFTGPGIRQWVPVGSTVLVAPFANGSNTGAELWQVDSGFRFRLVGGYAIRKVGARNRSLDAPQTALNQLLGVIAVGGAPLAPVATPQLVAEGRTELAASGASTVVVGPSVHETTELVRRVTLIVGRGPDAVVGGVSVWTLSPG